ncbi:MAG TPA: sigma factor-like helix-turn-helix DNA-binding protein [Tepidisphaeraceae bacterium]|jgi:DNA-directed RNA polymerase specialized sigma24 family protein
MPPRTTVKQRLTVLGNRSKDQALAKLCGEENHQAVRAAIEALPEPYRTVVMLRDIEGLDTDRTAALLQTTVACVKTRLHRSRLVLRKVLEPLANTMALEVA